MLYILNMREREGHCNCMELAIIIMFLWLSLKDRINLESKNWYSLNDSISILQNNTQTQSQETSPSYKILSFDEKIA